MRWIYSVTVLSTLIFFPLCSEVNQFSFCYDFDRSGCIRPIAGDAVFSTEKLQKKKTIADFANALYFRGDRLAFALNHARSKYNVTFECLRGEYTLPDTPGFKEDIEYIELREKNVYGLVMAGSLVEKKYAAIKKETYRALLPFSVEYSIFCHKDLIAKHSIRVVLK
ncbi:MAG TPA: hypothetical protein PLY93_13125 [Turneriella sp.]|nr:hypothetical protein [Turneriella sp.]